MGSTPKPFECAARPTRGAKVLSGVAVAVILVVAGVSLAVEGFELWPVLILGMCVLVVAVLMAWCAFMPARLRVDDSGIHISYSPFRRSVPWSQLQDVLGGDQIGGAGWGYGWRWEGRGRTAVRVGGPMITIVHTGGRIGVSVPDQRKAAAAISRLRP